MKKYIDRKLYLILLGYVLAYHVIYVSRRVILKLMGNQGYEDISWMATILEPVFSNFIIVPPIIVLILIVTKAMINKKYAWKYIIGAHFIFSIVYVGLLYIFSAIYINLFKETSIEIFSEQGLVLMLYGSNLNFLGYVGFVSIIYSYYYIDKTSKAELQKARLSEQILNIKMEALKSQLNPHFLFNTLNSISSLIKLNSDKAQEMISNLGDLFREILLLKHENRIALHQELRILKKYIEIMEVRFSDHLLVNIAVDPQLNDVLIPSMIIQPIIENSFNHGYSYEHTELEVNLNIYEEDQKLVVKVENNGALINAENKTAGIGIRNIKERLKTIYEDDFEFSFSNLNNKNGVVTYLKIPLQTNDS